MSGRDSEIHEDRYQAKQREQDAAGVTFVMTLVGILGGLYGAVKLIAPMM